MDLGLLLLRGAVAAALAIQGWSKLRREGRAGTAAFFRSVGFEPAAPLAALTGVVEVTTAVMLAAGLATSLAASGALAVLVSAAAVNAARGWASSNNGAEYPVTLALVVVGLAFTGPGALSVDGALGLDDVAGTLPAAALAGAVASTVPFLTRRHRQLRRSAATATA